MKFFSWNIEKNEQLKKERNVSFEEVVFFIEKEQLLDIVEYRGREKYPRQMILIVNIHDNAFLTPFIETNNGVLLKTIIPGRKATNEYLNG